MSLKVGTSSYHAMLMFYVYLYSMPLGMKKCHNVIVTILV